MTDREIFIRPLKEVSDYFFRIYLNSENIEEVLDAKDRYDAVENAIVLLKDPDRIKVTRCKDCKQAKEWPCLRNSDGIILCALRDEATKPDWFCANGERW